MTDRRVVYKYPFSDYGDPLEIPWDTSSRVLHVAAQASGSVTPTLWVEQPYPVTDQGTRVFILVGTGQEYEPATVHEYVASAVCADGRFVWHIFGSEVQVAF